MQNRNKLRFKGFTHGSLIKNLPANAGDVGSILGQDDPLEEEMATHSSILPGESHGQRTLAGYSPWGRKESDTTWQLHWTNDLQVR